MNRKYENIYKHETKNENAIIWLLPVDLFDTYIIVLRPSSIVLSIVFDLQRLSDLV